ncbi:Coenzyme F420 hydrogenase/dehydrogenase, beta subunit C-terminal domain [Prevotella sp. E13-27]|uniref:Coenzyme F420 hydrogenase/dehydrogenase, beta subunit C-terminal domain n=1 Tax=Prevotella sp. E13-27 TaxID=2938122 RepID=UPI002009E140|nr:Coenzyme F420 hydrogenase/dehydrogenase, beta subunit C-terminal domain [Prevotella sp. E13-27]MCK8623652.1 Coenzyme F420 hydrogenase/dehydrogenase, beta subunit C-terminal domain [Prevotella sp. E13-27]
MIDIKDKKDCCGCNACYDACPKDAIRLNTDIEGFWYPEVDKNKCINCGLCDKVCPQLHVDELKHNEFEKPVCFAAIHKNIETRFASTTGGLFSALAEQMYEEGGYVGGAIYREDWSVAHFISNNPDDLQRIRQSKYSQSDTRGFYKEVKRLLLTGEKVLVCGSPCQMAALRRFLGKDYPSLIIVDYICKSITSPLFYQKYLDFWERKAGSKLISFKFKDKELGWRNLVKRFDFKNGKTMYSRAQDNDLYSTAYHGHIVSRPSCYDCKFKGFPRMADITIADFWGCEKKNEYRELDDNAGTSAVIVNNSRGLDFFKKIEKHIRCVPADINDMIPGNPALLHSEKYPTANRTEFFRELNEKSIEEAVEKHLTYFGQTTGHGFKHKLRLYLRVWRTALKHSQYKPSVFFQFIRLNVFCKNVKTDWQNEGVIYPTPFTIIELQKGSLLELHGPLVVGSKKVKKSHEETRLLLERDARMIVNEDSHFDYGSDVEVFPNAELIMGHCGTNHNCTIICGKRIEMQGRVSLGRDVSIRDTNAHLIAIEGYKILRPVIIENHVWLCSGATICPGVKIKAGAVVGANSYVIQNVPAHSLVSGNPAKVVMKNIAWKL